MNFNIIGVDRSTRLLISIVVSILIIAGWLSIEWILLSFVLTTTAAFKFCPVYKIVNLFKKQ